MNGSGDIERILDSCLTAVLDQGQPLDSCLAAYPEQRNRLEPLLILAVGLQTAQTIEPSAEFRSVAQVRMQNLLAAHPRATSTVVNNQPRRWDGWFSRGAGLRRGSLAVLASLIMLIWLLVGGGIIAAAESSMPGQPFYEVKRTVERTRLALTTDEAARARLHLWTARRRMAEASALLAIGQASAIDAPLQSIDKDIAAILEQLQGPVLTDGQRKAVATELAAQLEALQAELTVWQGHTSGPAQSRIVASQALVAGSQETVQKLLGTEPEPPSLLPRGTSTAVPTPTPTPVPTGTQIPSVVGETPTADSADSNNALPPTRVKGTLSVRIDGCQIGPGLTGRLLEDCLKPRFWPTVQAAIPPVPSRFPPSDWPEDCPIPSDWPFDWPEGCPFPEEWPPIAGDWTPPPLPEDGTLPEIPAPPLPIPDPPVAPPRPATPQTPDIPDPPDPPDAPDPPEPPNPPAVPVPPASPDPPQPPEPPDIPDPPDVPQPPNIGPPPKP